MLQINKGQLRILAIMGAIILGLLAFIIFKDAISNSQEFQGDEIISEELPEQEETWAEGQITQIQGEDSQESQTIKVYITGQVQQPGVIEVPNGCRLNEAIEMAGGFLPEADLLRVNLAIKVEDEGMYLIPKIGEDAPPMDSIISGSQGDTDKVNINKADQSQLETLPRIGPVTAQNIIQYREENGPFMSIEDIMNVPRIGEKTFEGLKDHITVN
ncbi:MAG: transporter [Clostridiales bacterium]|nr:transporter [Clostridiales bacterium]